MLSKFPNKTLKVGAIVSLSPQTTWYKNRLNPIGVKGRVERVDSVFFERGGGGLRVCWDNGYSNNYRQNDYDLIAEGEPGFLATE